MNSILHRDVDGGLAFGQPLVCPTTLVDEFDGLAMKALPHATPDRGLAFGTPLPYPISLVDESDKMAREMWCPQEPLVFHTNLISCLHMYEPERDLCITAERPSVRDEDYDISLVEGVLTAEEASAGGG